MNEYLVVIKKPKLNENFAVIKNSKINEYFAVIKNPKMKNISLAYHGNLQLLIRIAIARHPENINSPCLFYKVTLA